MLFLLQFCCLSAQTVSGVVTDRQSGETLIGATVVDKRSGKGVLSNSYGFYSLPLKADSVSPKKS